MTHELTKFGGGNHEISTSQYEKLKQVLLPTGKFIEVDGSLINISEIKSIEKKKLPPREYDVTKIEL